MAYDGVLEIGVATHLTTSIHNQMSKHFRTSLKDTSALVLKCLDTLVLVPKCPCNISALVPKCSISEVFAKHNQSSTSAGLNGL